MTTSTSPLSNQSHNPVQGPHRLWWSIRILVIVAYAICCIVGFWHQPTLTVPNLLTALAILAMSLAGISRAETLGSIRPKADVLRDPWFLLLSLILPWVVILWVWPLYFYPMHS